MGRTKGRASDVKLKSAAVNTRNTLQQIVAAEVESQLSEEISAVSSAVEHVADELAETMEHRSEIYSKKTPIRDLNVKLKRAEIDFTEDLPIWSFIRTSTENLSYCKYEKYLNVNFDSGPSNGSASKSIFIPRVESYTRLKALTDGFLIQNCGVTKPRADVSRDLKARGIEDDSEIPESTDIVSSNYFQKLLNAAVCKEEYIDKFHHAFCLLELIWSYWHEESMLVQTFNAICLRFQNKRSTLNRDPLSNLEIAPLHQINNLLWGFIQDEQHRLSVNRRAYEYDHHYGISLRGRAVGNLKTADSRTKFINAFHNLLHLCTIFFKQDDDATVMADGFPLLNGLKEVHIILSEGQHNQYGDLPWTARAEMLMMQWLLARREIQQFLPSRISVIYPEPWMSRVECMNRIQGWTDTSVLHYSDLANFGEKILLSIRYSDWSIISNRDQAGNWARYWRSEIQGYIHAYRAVTGIDLSARSEAFTSSMNMKKRAAAAGR